MTTFIVGGGTRWAAAGALIRPSPADVNQPGQPGDSGVKSSAWPSRAKVGAQLKSARNPAHTAGVQWLTSVNAKGGRRYLAAAAALGVAQQVGVAFTVQLLDTAPLLLIALSPLGRNLLLTAPLTTVVPFTLVAAGRRALGSALGYQLSRVYGRRALDGLDRRAPRIARFMRAFERMFRRADVPMSFLIPRGSAVVAGAAGMPFGRYMLLSTAGHTFWCYVTYRVGDALSDYITPLLAYIQTHRTEVTAFFMLLVALQVLYHRTRRSRSPIDSA